MTQLAPGVIVNVSQSPLAQSTNVPGEGLAAFAAAYNIGPTNPVQVNSWGQFTKLFGTFAQANGALFHQSVYQFFANGGASCFAVRIPNTDAVAAKIEIPSLATGASGVGSQTAVLSATANSVGAWANQVYIGITAAGTAVTEGGGSQQRFNFQVYVGGTAASNLMETFPSLSINPADSRYVVSVVNSITAGSNYVTIKNLNTTYSASVNDPYVSAATFYQLGNSSGLAYTAGSDGTTAPTMGSAVPTAYNQLQDQVLYLNIPGPLSVTDATSLVSWAQGRGDVMILADGPIPSPPEVSSNVATAYSNLAASYTSASQIAVYGPYLWTQDPSSGVNGAMTYVPPCGAVLAIWQRAAQNYNVAQAPAGTWATVNTAALETNFTATDVVTLRTAQVNPIKLIPNVGFCVFGANTLASGVPSMYVNIQRALIEITHDLENLCQYAIFQPNNATLWENITSTITSYLTQQMQAGVLAGSTPATAFTVLCDDTINTPTSAQSGFVYAQVGVAISSPAEFLTINLALLSGSTSSSTTTA